MWKRYPDQFLFKDHDEELVCVMKAQMPISVVKQWKAGKECEMICELSDINSDHTMHIKSLKRIRVIEKQTKFAGTFPEPRNFVPCGSFLIWNSIFMANHFKVRSYT